MCSDTMEGKLRAVALGGLCVGFLLLSPSVGHVVFSETVTGFTLGKVSTSHQPSSP